MTPCLGGTSEARVAEWNQGSEGAPRRKSEVPSTAVVTTGTPAAIASMGATGVPSLRELLTTHMISVELHGNGCLSVCLFRERESRVNR